MKNLMKVFEHEKFGSVRTVYQNNEPWFVAKDVCECLSISKYRNAISRLDEDEREPFEVDTLGGKQEMTAINEYGLYSLVLSSRKPEAKEFKRWITHEVIPAIRKTGMYMTDNAIDNILGNPDAFIKVLSEYKKVQDENKALAMQNASQKQLIGELKPKADYTDLILKSKSLVTITQIAKDYGMSGQAMNKILHNLGIIYNQSGQWLLYSKHQAKGYTHSETVNIVHSDGREDVKMNTKWTQKGRLFLYNTLKKENIIPVIEKGA